jgi:hypothetical protein
MAAVPKIEERVEALEAEMSHLKEQLEKAGLLDRDWLDEVYGVFDNDPIYKEAMRLGREYRESLRRKTPRDPRPKPERNL